MLTALNNSKFQLLDTKLNPTETDQYYLQSRYYDAGIGRFINADDTGILGLSGNQLLGVNLFAYCNNNVINIVDNSGEFGFIVKAIKKAIKKVVVEVAKVVVPALADFPWALVSPLVMAYQSAEDYLAYENYKYNKSRSTTKLVNDQSSIKMKFGLITIAKMGCGVVALHNLLCLLNKKSDLAVISYLLETRGYIFGYAGASIFTMGKLLKELGIKNKTELFPGTVDSKIKKSKVAIIAYLHSNGGHFITVKWNEKRKTFEIYNGNIKYTKQRVNSIDSHLKEQKGVLGIIYLS